MEMRSILLTAMSAIMAIAGVAQAACPGRTNSVGMVFRAIPAGRFVMGSGPDEPGRAADEALQAVVLTRGFWIQQTEVTQGQWRAVMGDNPSRFGGCDDCPVENVSWRLVQAFIARLNQIEQTQAYRLPTEAEWEHACRAGRREPFMAGKTAQRTCDYDAQHDPLGWYLENAGNRTHPAARKTPNPWGLYDLHGNVWEWCADYYAPREPLAEAVVDPTGPNFGWGRVFKGGGYNFPAKCSRAANRKWSPEGFACGNLGFRVVRDDDSWSQSHP